MLYTQAYIPMYGFKKICEILDMNSKNEEVSCFWESY